VSLFKKSLPVDPADQCTKCRKPVGNTFMRESILRRYGKNPEELLLIATGQIEDPDNMVKAEAIGAGGFVCRKCHKKYCAECGGRMIFACCGARMFIGTHYLV
jgi:hypothetical protein